LLGGRENSPPTLPENRRAERQLRHISQHRDDIQKAAAAA
jgi:hypothetical protein